MANSERPQVCVQADLEGVVHAAAEAVVALSSAAIEARGRFTIALTGGRTAPPLYQLLAEAHRDRVAWDRWHVFWSDERYVAPESDLSNYYVARAALLTHVPIPAAQIHPMTTLMPSPQEAAQAYEEELTQCFSGELPRFDLMLLGMGAEGHIASLLPHSPALEEAAASRLVMAVAVPSQPPFRLTMTLPVINNAENVFFLVAGADKSAALERAVTGEPNAWECPASAVHPTNGVVMWWVDEAAFTYGRKGSLKE